MKTIQTILIVLLIAIIVWLLFFRKPNIHIIPDPHYITDTIWLDKPYPVPEPYPVSVPPVTLTYHVIDSAAIDSLKLILQEKDILIQSLHFQVSVSQNFLKQFPYNPKLLELNLNLDTLSISTLNIDGIPSKSNYPLFLSDFRYKWTIERLSKKKINPPPVIKSKMQYFGGGGVNFLYLSPYAEFNIEKDWTRIRVYSDIRVMLLKYEASSINLGIKYNLKINGSN